MEPPPLKPTKWHIFCRWYAALGMVAFYACLGGAAYASMDRPNPAPALFGACIGAAFLVGTPAVVMLLSICGYPLGYSLFGPYLRRSFPGCEPVHVVRNSWAVIGWLRLSIPMVTWLVFPDGLGLRVMLYGTAYVPAECITHVETLRFGRRRVHHTCSDVRSPITMPGAVLAVCTSMWRDKWD